MLCINFYKRNYSQKFIIQYLKSTFNYIDHFVKTLSFLFLNDLLVIQLN